MQNCIPSKLLYDQLIIDYLSSQWAVVRAEWLMESGWTGVTLPDTAGASQIPAIQEATLQHGLSLSINSGPHQLDISRLILF